MRYYVLTITNPNGGQTHTWTSHPGGTYDPSALNLYFDAFVVDLYPGAAGASTVGLEGVDREYLNQPQQFNEWNFELTAGMLGGLPLAAAQPQPGTILKGQVFGTFGNWVGHRISLDFVVISAGGYTQDNPGNFVFNWSAGTQLSDALRQTLQTAYPDRPIKIEIGKYVSPHSEHGFWATATSLARLVNRLTFDALGPKGPSGVSIYLNNGTVLVTDGSTASQQTPTKIKYTDLIGQPTWVAPGIVAVPVVLRSDVQVGDVVQLPQYLAGSQDVSGLPGTAQVIPNVDNAKFNYPLTFRGDFRVIRLRQIGQFRGGSGEDWMTVLECAALQPKFLPAAAA